VGLDPLFDHPTDRSRDRFDGSPQTVAVRDPRCVIGDRSTNPALAHEMALEAADLSAYHHQ
jgi:hypothetical protein